MINKKVMQKQIPSFKSGPIYLRRNSFHKGNYSINLFMVSLFLFSALAGLTPLRAQNANLAWVKSMGGTSSIESKGMTLDAAGNIYITGYFSSSTIDFDPGPGTANLTQIGLNDIFIAKYDSKGNYVWAKCMGSVSNDVGASIKVDGSGNIYLVGTFIGTADFDPGAGVANLTAQGLPDIFIAKYDPNGNYLWAKKIGITGYNQGTGIDLDGAGNLYVTGFFSGAPDFDPGPGVATRTSLGGYDAFLAKYDAQGNYVWAISMGGNRNDQPFGIAVDALGNSYIFGYHNSNSVDFDPGPDAAIQTVVGSTDLFLAKYDANGKYVWAKIIAGTGAEYGLAIALDKLGSIVVTGYLAGTAGADFDPGPGIATLTAASLNDAFVAKYDTDGNYKWAKNCVQGTGSEQGLGITTDAIGNIYMIGIFTLTGDFDPGPGLAPLTSIGGNDAFVVKYDLNGDYAWAISLGSTSTDYITGIVNNPAGEVLVTGSFYGTVDFDPGPGELKLVGSTSVLSAYILALNQRCEIIAELSRTACDSFVHNGVSYKASGQYRDTFETVAKCDSIIILNLTIKGRTSANADIVDHFCDSVVFNNITYKAPGIYTQYYTNTSGCDSNITYNLSWGQRNTGSVALSACDSLYFNDTVFTSSGAYSFIYTNSAGCDSVFTLDLVIHPSPRAEVVLNGYELTATEADGYQWLDCNEGLLPINGAIRQKFMAMETGDYAVVIINKTTGCSDTSLCTFVNVPTGIYEEDSKGGVVLYPNPTKGRMTVQMDPLLGERLNVRVLNILGQPMEVVSTFSSTATVVLELTPLAQGIYFIELGQGSELKRFKVVKE